MRLLASPCPSVRPHGTTRLPLDGFWWNLAFETFSKIRREYSNSSFIKIRQKWRLLYRKTFNTFMKISRWFILRMRYVSNKSCRENQNTHFMFSNFFFRVVYEIMSKYMMEPLRPRIIWRLRVARWINKATRAKAHASALALTNHAHALPPPPYTHRNLILTDFPRQRWFRERSSELYYTCIVCPVLLLSQRPLKYCFNFQNQSLQSCRVRIHS